jgi:hypothetical protein
MNSEINEMCQIVSHITNHLSECPQCSCKLVDILGQIELEKNSEVVQTLDRANYSGKPIVKGET